MSDDFYELKVIGMFRRMIGKKKKKRGDFGILWILDVLGARKKRDLRENLGIWVV